MYEVLLLVFPIFALIAIGYGLVFSGVIQQDVGNAISKFVFTVPLPLLLFRSLATSNVGEQAPWSLWGIYFFCMAVVWGTGMLAVRYAFGREGSVLAVAGISAGFSNLVLLGLPVISGVFGQDSLVPLVMLLTVHLPITMLSSSLFVEWYSRDGGDLQILPVLAKVGKGLASNPIIIGIVAGGLWSFIGWDVPLLAMKIIEKITPITVPLALMAMGMGMRDYGLKGDIMPGIALALLKTMVFPALFLLVATYVFPLPAHWVAVILLGAAAPTGVNAYLLANHFGVGHRLSANTITLGVLMSLVTLPFWITIARGIFNG